MYANENDPGVRGKLMLLERGRVTADVETWGRQEGAGYGEQQCPGEICELHIQLESSSHSHIKFIKRNK